jgi:prepilin-type N-terminal cleavage/methylation domain-containing protein
MKNLQAKIKGFTLFEMLLVLAIMSAILILLSNYTSQRLEQFRRDRTALQMQQILNAGMAYYINNSYWPAQSGINGACSSTSLSSLQPNYIPSGLVSPYGVAYSINCNITSGVFSVSLAVPGTKTGAANAQIITGMIPLGTYSGSTVTGQVNIPGQNLNNARSVNFAGYYHNGACVPAPTCPGNMAPDILVVPVSLYGVNDMSASASYYALYGFTAYAYGAPGNPPGSTPQGPTNVADCTSPATASGCYSSNSPSVVNASSSYLYWRVCLSVTTEKGVVSSTATDSSWGQYATVMAITRCVPANEVSGSDFTVWTK